MIGQYDVRTLARITVILNSRPTWAIFLYQIQKVLTHFYIPYEFLYFVKHIWSYLQDFDKFLLWQLNKAIAEMTENA